jgi:phenylacetate-CoA ligase
LRGTPVPYYLEQLKESQWWSEEELRAAQLEKLRSLLAHAREHSPFYREYFERHGFDCDAGSIEDIKALPSLGKKEIVSRREEIQNRGGGGRLVFSKTAGTTSLPLLFYRTAEWDAQHRAAIMRGCSWYGVDPWTRSGHLSSIPPRSGDRVKMRLFDCLLNRFREKRFDLAAGTFEDFYRKLAGAECLAGYSSMLYEFARFVNERHPDEALFGLKLVRATSEKIFPHYRDEAQRAFAQPMRGEYGSAEAGIIAFECPAGSLHVNMEHVIVEVENDEIVVTNLVSHSFPFIRYRLGDYVRLKDAFACPCGRKGLVIADVLGRVGLKVRGKGGTTFPTMAIDRILSWLATLGALVGPCQVVQRVEGRLDFYIVPGRTFVSGEAARVGDYVEGLILGSFGDAIDVEVHFVESIPRPRGKFLEFVSDLRQEN